MQQGLSFCLILPASLIDSVCSSSLLTVFSAGNFSQVLHHSMKRVFDEISDDEWSNHSFKPSRVFSKPQTQPPIPPPIESFAYQPPSLYISDDSGDDCVVVMESSKNFKESLEDDDVEVEGVKSSTAMSRGRRFVVDDEDEESEKELTEVCDVRSTSEEEEEEGGGGGGGGGGQGG
ncbi:Protein CHROMATIN REMODELING 19, partial [Cucurbita argyrosperma subsp. argyrosperma]